MPGPWSDRMRVVWLLIDVALNFMVPFSGEKWMAFSNRLASAARSKFLSPWMMRSDGMSIFRVKFFVSRLC